MAHFLTIEPAYERGANPRMVAFCSCGEAKGIWGSSANTAGTCAFESTAVKLLQDWHKKHLAEMRTA